MGNGEKNLGAVAPSPFSSKVAIRFCRLVLADLKREYAIFALSAVFFSVISLLPPQLMHYFSKHLPGLTEGSVDPLLKQLAIFGMVIAVCMTLAIIVKLMVKEWLQLRLEVHLRRSLLVRLHRMPLDQLQGMQRGDWLTKASGDIRSTEEILGTTLPDFAYNAILVVGTSILLLYYSGPIALIPISSALLVAGVNLRLQRLLLPLLNEMRTLYAGLFQVLIENLEGWKTIRSQHAFPAEQKRVDEKLGSFREKGMVVARVISRTVSAHDFVTSTLITVCLMTLAWGVANGRITAQEALFYPFYLGQFFFAVRGMVQAVNGWNRFLPSGNRLAAFFDSEKVLAPEVAHVRVLLPNNEKPSRLVVKNLAMGFAKRLPLLQNLSFEVTRGEIHGVVGPSGAGKSTLLEFLSGLRMAISGRLELKSPTETTLWAQESPTAFSVPTDFCAYVEQKPYLFEGTVRANLTLGADGFDDEALWHALKAVGLALTFRQREGLETLLSDRGVNVSGGELYRIALARVMLLNRPFLLLDEPFAALDEVAAGHLVTLLDELKAEMGILIVTHFTPPTLKFSELYSLFPARGMVGNNSNLDFVSERLRAADKQNSLAIDGLAKRETLVSIN